MSEWVQGAPPADLDTGLFLQGACLASTCAFWCLFPVFVLFVHTLMWFSAVIPLAFNQLSTSSVCQMSSINNPNHVLWSSWSVWLSRSRKPKHFLGSWHDLQHRKHKVLHNRHNKKECKFWFSLTSRCLHLHISGYKQSFALMHHGGLTVSRIRQHFCHSCLHSMDFVTPPFSFLCAVTPSVYCVLVCIRSTVMAVGNFVVIVRQWRITLR